MEIINKFQKKWISSDKIVWQIISAMIQWSPRAFWITSNTYFHWNIVYSFTFRLLALCTFNLHKSNGLDYI